MVLVELAAEPATVTGGRAGPSYLSLPAGPAVGNAARCGATPQPAELAAETEAWLGLATCLMVRSAARCDAAPPSAGPMAERDVTVLRGRDGEASAALGVLSARGVGRGAIVGARPPLGGHALQRGSVDDNLKPHVSTQRGSNKH